MTFVWPTSHVGMLHPLAAIGSKARKQDVVLRISDGEIDRLVIVDAKNRTLASESDVAYKLMGYKENLGIEGFQAVGMYPSLSGELRLRRLQEADEQILLFHVPLSNGRKTVQRIARRFVGVPGTGSYVSVAPRLTTPEGATGI